LDDDERAGLGARLAAGAIVGLLGLGAASAYSLSKDAPSTAAIVAPATDGAVAQPLTTEPSVATTVAPTTTPPNTKAPVPAVPATCPAPDAAPTGEKVFTAAPTGCIDPKARYRAVVTTSEGEFTIELDQSKAPLTVNSFVFLARKGFYDGLTFHRVIPDFIIQGGDPKADGTGNAGYTIPDELSKSATFQIGTVATANSGPNSNGSQFFVVSGKSGVGIPNTSTIFGRVVKGTKTLDAIDKLGLAPSPDGRELPPALPITITSVTISAKGESVSRIPGLVGLGTVPVS
jgi:cyclophilin family peptidyl-prolyl cis-trans isomerase